MFSAPQPLRQERQVEEDVPLGLRIETGLIRLKDLIISLFPYPTEPDHEVTIILLVLILHATCNFYA